MDDGSAEDFILEESIGCGHPVPSVSDPVCERIAQATDAFVTNGPYLLDVEETARTLHAVCHDKYKPHDMPWMLMQCVRCVEASERIRLDVAGACMYDHTFKI
ncbi:hypothetical protein TW95_gp0935 [Pandoravirus inopinatum]|uniref:Uncharacterized protein n=1 Tax=Pandoravirus inopinatum TaxID=1605721 RepID=A0A0B5J2B7_9VIRU|nr:hypothetical protein TW95_gp0935 [Pandoravirus inopinatum]AJF97669.1 hypothetical protein [Pandoravirus inopinatum]